MEIKIDHNEDVAKNQFDYLININFQSLSVFTRRILIFSIVTLISLISLHIENLSGATTIFVMAGIMGILATLYNLVLFFTLYLKRTSVRKWRDLRLKDLRDAAPYYLSFDEERITTRSANYKMEIKWSLFKYHIITNNTLYLLPDKNYITAQ